MKHELVEWLCIDLTFLWLGFEPRLMQNKFLFAKISFSMNVKG